MQSTQTSASPNFFGLGIAPKLLDALEKIGYSEPTPIQFKSIPPAIEGKDLVGIAQTGTGKTLAFGIPLIQRLAQVKGKGLIIAPTRELALQIDEELMKFGRSVGLRTAVLIGGQSIRIQHQKIRKIPHVIIATPGRLIDHLEQKTVQLSDVRVLILDEADRMFDMGFAPQIKRILQVVPDERQTMLFSATMPAEIMNLAREYMKLPIRIEIAPAGTAAEKVVQEVFIVRKDEKFRMLEKVLYDYHGSVLVFSRTKHGAHRIAREVKEIGHEAAEIHSDRSLSQRKNALDGFKNGRYRVLIATDIAARGIDVKGIELVLNYDLPDNPEDYVHRIGRTGRAGLAGRAISFATPDQGSDIRAIERLIRTPISKSSLSGVSLPAEREHHRPERSRGSFVGHRRAGPSHGRRSLQSPRREQSRPQQSSSRGFWMKSRHSDSSGVSRNTRNRRKWA